MNASEFNTRLNKLLSEAVTDGISRGKMSPETIIGILEVHKANMVDLRKAIAMEQMAAQQIVPAGSIGQIIPGRLTNPQNEKR